MYHRGLTNWNLFTVSKMGAYVEESLQTFHESLTVSIKSLRENDVVFR